MSQIFGDISCWCRRNADGHKSPPASSFLIREGGDASYYNYDPVTLEEGDDDDDGGYDYAPAA